MSADDAKAKGETAGDPAANAPASENKTDPKTDTKADATVDAKAEPVGAAAPSASAEGKDKSPAPPLWHLPEAIGWRDHVVGAAIGLAVTAWLLATARGLGFARDEGFYFQSATTYAAWFEEVGKHGKRALEQSVVDRYWSTNHEHPSLIKSLFALSWATLHEKHRVFSDASTAFRFPAMALAGVASWVTYLFGARVFSRAAGVVAAVLLPLMPHLFYNAHLACFDVPVLTMWILAVYTYYRSSERGTVAWAALFGVVYGLTLETKHNAWILPAVFVPHAIFVQLRAMKASAPRARFPLNLVAMATLGPLVFVALWPWLWFDTEARIREYVNFHVNHEYYNIEFLGRNYFGPPSPPLYAPVLILASVPTVTLLLFAVGAFDRAKEGLVRLRAYFAKDATASTSRFDPATDLLLGLAFAAPIAVFFLPKTPIFGGTKHWMPAYPLLALFAGRGFDLAREAAKKLAASVPALTPHARALPWVLAGAAIVGPFAITRHSHPFGLSTYVPIVGGTAGGADLGLNRQFWGYTTESLAPYFERVAPRGATVFIHDTAWQSWERLLDEKRLRPDLRGVGSPTEAQFAIVHHELHMNEVDHGIWAAYESTAPDYVLLHDGVPIVSVYRRK